MDGDSKKKISLDNDAEYRLYCLVCYKLALGRNYDNYLKSQTHINKFRKIQQIENKNNSTSSQKKTLNELLLQIMR